jgi:hypothetical protein
MDRQSQPPNQRQSSWLLYSEHISCGCQYQKLGILSMNSSGLASR